MNTRNLLRKLPSCLLGAIFAAGVASTMVSTTVNAVDGDPPGLFELDGNTLNDPAVEGTDWGQLYSLSLNVPPGPFPANMITFTGITADPSPLSIYAGGGSKDVNDVTQWLFKDGSAPDKDDITNAYAAAFTNPADICVDNLTDNNEVPCATPNSIVRHAEDDLIIYFGLDRFANDGDAFAGFWFFQEPVAANGPKSKGGSKFTGQHLEGDILVLVEYPQASGATPTIKVYKWVDSGGDVDTHLQLLITETNALCDANDGISKLACAISNTSPLTNEPAWPYTPKSGNANDVPFESFYEGGINVTQLLGTTPCFAAFLAETRSSRSETATLKDFVIDEFPVCGTAVTKSCDTANIVGDTATVNFSGTASNTGGQSVFIELLDNPVGTFTAVCFDTTGTIGKCDGTDAVPADLNALPAATATFTLGADDAVDDVRYEGTYTVNDISGITFTDIVTLNFYADSTKDVLLGSHTATDSCNADVNPKLLITKECDPFIGSDGVRLVVDGTQVVVEVGNIIKVKNDGTEPLIDVSVSDSEVQELLQSAGPTFDCSAGTECTGGLAVGETAEFTQTYRPDSVTGGGDPSTVVFSNTATANGTGAFSGTAAPQVQATAACDICAPHTVP